MPLSSSHREPTCEFLCCVEREEELGRLRNQAKIRKSMLVHGRRGWANRIYCARLSQISRWRSMSHRCVSGHIPPNYADL